MQKLTLKQRTLIFISKSLYNLGDYISKTRFINLGIGYDIYNWCIIKSIDLAEKIDDKDYLWKD